MVEETKCDWAESLFEVLIAIDRDQCPHGLYGIRRALTPDDSSVLLPYGRAFTRKLFDRLFAQHSIERRRFSDHPPSFVFFHDGAMQTKVMLTIWDDATTKVRKFGKSYRLDSGASKAGRDSRDELRKLLPKLHRAVGDPGGKDGSAHDARGILLIDHFTGQHLRDDFPDHEFLQRYDISYLSRTWNDRYDRGFKTSLHLWKPAVRETV